MKIVAGADWRDTIPFESPMLVSDLAPGDDARCAGCRADTPPHPRTELWAVKHRHPQNHSGYVRFYCAEHRPAPPAPPVERRIPSSATQAARERAPRRVTPPVVETPRALCPDCFIEVPASGVCGMCGQQVA